MADESLIQGQIELSNLGDIKDKQREKDFDDIIKMVEKMTPEEQKSFVEKMKEKDPVFRGLYDELKTYFDSQLGKLEKEEEQKQTQKPKNKSQTEAQKEIQKQAKDIFTITENAYRAGMYEALDIEGGWQAATGIDLENDTAKDIFRKKGFELVSNGVLFGLFRASGWGKEKILQQLGNPKLVEKLPGKLVTYGIKTSAEATFFTYYTIAFNNLQDSVKNGGNIKEMLESFTNIGNTNDLIKLFAYNLGFISLVKGGGQIIDLGNLKILQNKLNNELNSLSERGIYFENGRFFKGNNEVPVLLIPEFQRFAEINKKMAELSVDNYRKPESGRAGKTMNTNQVDPAKRFERLAKYSTQTQDGKISYALNDKTIGETLQVSGLNAGKGVGEGLLKKSGFSNDEINQFREGKLKGEKPNETKAINEMNKAMEVVYREYKEGYKKINEGIPIEKVFPNLSDKLITKLERVYTIDYEILPRKK